MYHEDRERKRVRVLAATAVLACLTLLAAVIPSPYSIERPGPFVDTLGDATLEDETIPVIQISDLQTYPTTGELNLLTVSILGTPEHPLSWLSLVPALFDPSQRIAPRTEFFPEGVSEKERETANTAMMDTSQMQSAAAAFRELGEPVSIQLSVAGISEDGPAEGILEQGDVILTVGGQEIASFEQLRRVIVDAGADRPLAVTVLRGDEELSLTLTPRVPDGGDSPMLGAAISSSYELPAEVKISLSQIGGPSAGMIFAIGIYDLLTPGPLLDGLTVSGTGTISEEGDVGAIGGLAQKMWAASRAESDLFLMPLENCAELPDQIPAGLTVAPVSTLNEAIKAIETATSGGTPAGIERCEVK
ncbi:PDZ domain-containing protein [Leucobacter insecticola]|uniref:PDZ domain-containing protein n=1 Tax=Leucobacter insecticola TaxID=2714934 RepID=A0A6G8FL48_9MICO|nr:S16 family serine protease [Leucobacter insecticola]QIM16802.1 PDZ domain-containing protein [Leucobacter insecticola]